MSTKPFPLIADAHLDLAWNAIDWNRDLLRPCDEIRRQEKDAGMTQKARGENTVSFPDLRRGRLRRHRGGGLRIHDTARTQSVLKGLNQRFILEHAKKNSAVQRAKQYLPIARIIAATMVLNFAFYGECKFAPSPIHELAVQNIRLKVIAFLSKVASELFFVVMAVRFHRRCSAIRLGVGGAIHRQDLTDDKRRTPAHFIEDLTNIESNDAENENNKPGKKPD
jgi:hypothetical protein